MTENEPILVKERLPICVLEIEKDPMVLIRKTVDRLKTIAFENDLRVKIHVEEFE